MKRRSLTLVYHAWQVYWIDLLLFVSAIPLVGWLTFGFVDSIQRNDSRGIQVWLGLTIAAAFFLGLLIVTGVISI